MQKTVLILACGALAGELTQLIRLNGWANVSVACLPAELHDTPRKIPDAIRKKIEVNRLRFDTIFAAYADCGTGGQLDRLLLKYGIERLPGAHCYEFFAGSAAFSRLSAGEPGTFYLTDFLVRHFDRLVYRGLGLDRHPELKAEYFSNYRRLVHLAQTDDEDVRQKAEEHAERLGLAYEHHYTGLGKLQRHIEPMIQQVVKCQS